MLREQYIIMAKNTHTPVTYWLDMSIPRLRKWIQANNNIIERQKQEMKT